jgi:hypothetical protein
MKKLGLLLVFLCVTFSVGLRAQSAVPLGSDATYVVLAATTITNTGATILNGNLGLSPGTAVTGFPPGQVIGTQNIANAAAATAQNDLTTAYTTAAGEPATATVSGDLGGQTLTSGVYKSTSTLGITGTLTLSGPGFFIFQVGSALTTASSSQVVLINGAQPANVFWQVGSSATLGTTSTFIGTILAQASITLNTGAVLDGRALARTGAVTLAGNQATDPGGATGGGPPPALSIACPSGFAPVGVPYSSAEVASGGTPPYTFFIVGTLPPGLTLNTSNGAITGTATGGSSTFVAGVNTPSGPFALNTCTITNTAGTGTPGGPGGVGFSVPTLSSWGLGMLALLLVGYAVGFRRKAHA